MTGSYPEALSMAKSIRLLLNHPSRTRQEEEQLAVQSRTLKGMYDTLRRTCPLNLSEIEEAVRRTS